MPTPYRSTTAYRAAATTYRAETGATPVVASAPIITRRRRRKTRR